MTIKHNDEIEKLKKIGFIYYVQEIIPSKEKYDEDFRYIGKTTQTIPERMKEHFGSAMNSLKSGFYKAIFENG